MSDVFKRAVETAVVERADYALVLQLTDLKSPAPVHLRDSALAVWRLVDGNRTTDEIVALVAQSYPVDAAEIDAPIRELLAALHRQGILEEVRVS